MKIIALNCGNDGESSSIILENFLNGARDEGAEIELFHSKNLDIKPCKACTSESNFESPGHCLNKDDMNSLYPKFKESDVWVFATPVNSNGSIPLFMNILDRLEPLFQPSVIFADDETESIEKKSNGKIVFISSTGNKSINTFDPLVDQIKSLSILFDKEFTAALLRPQSTVLSAIESFGASTNDVFRSAHEAGRELVRNGSITENLQNKISRELIAQDSFLNEMNILVKNQN